MTVIERPVLRYHGGKFRLAPELLKLFPPHRVYTEAFGGGASVLLLKPRCYSEIYNDLDGEVVNVFRVLQNPRRARRLEALLRRTPFARQEFLLSYKYSRSEVERARRTLIRAFMGWGSDSVSRTKATRAGFNTRISSTMSTGFRWNSNRSGTTAASGWMGFPQHIAGFCERLQGVTIEQRDAKDILRKMDRPDCLHFVDPPYPHSSRREGNKSTPEHRYRHEMTDRDHCNLATVLHSLKGMVIVSSYPGPLYERLYKTWKRVSWTGGQFCSSNGNHQTRTECAWMNPACVAAQNAKELLVSKPKKITELELRIEQLRILCQMQEASYRSGAVDLKIAVRDAMCFFDRAEASKTEWTAEDVRRLQHLRAIAKSVTS